MDRLYLMPLIDVPDYPHPGETGRQPKYWTLVHGIPGATTRQMDYGLEPVCLFAALGIDAATHTTMTTDPEVNAFPPDLTTQIGANLSAVQAALDARNIPNQWIPATWTYRQLLRAIIILFQLGQRLHGLGAPRLFGGGVTLATPFNQLPAVLRTALQDMATSFNFDSSGLTGASPLRQILKALYDQWPPESVYFGEAF
jgi:hypothetical protein